jgi:hypothetical protein
MHGTPPKVLGDTRRTGDQGRRVARPARGVSHFDLPPCNTLRGVNHLAHRVAAPTASKVVRAARPASRESVQRQNMGTCPILDVNVVSQARPVWRGIVRSKDSDVWQTPRRYLQNQRNEVRLRIKRSPQHEVAPAALK